MENFSYDQAAQSVKSFREQHPGAKIGMTSGCYDLLHAGHRTMLQECGKNCDFLVVIVVPDSHVKKNKSADSFIKPVITNVDRAALVNDLKYVGHAVVLEVGDASRNKIINDIVKPDVYFLGIDQNAKKYESVIPDYCKLQRISLPKDHSTSQIINQILKGDKTKNYFQSGKNWVDNSEWYR